MILGECAICTKMMMVPDKFAAVGPNKTYYSTFKTVKESETEEGVFDFVGDDFSVITHKEPVWRVGEQCRFSLAGRR
jgi:hypothetical protein